MKTLIKVLLLIGLLTFSAAVCIAESAANEVLINKVLATFSLDRSAYVVEVLSAEFITKDFTENEIELKSLYSTEPLGRFAVVATITKNKVIVESRQVRLFIHKFDSVVVANDRIARFAELSENSVSIIRKDISDLREQPVLSIATVKGNRTRRNIIKGAVLTMADIEPMPVIKSHQDIHLVYVSGLCRVTSQGEALQDGRVGDFIKVKNKSSGKIVMARVVDETVASVGP